MSDIADLMGECVTLRRCKKDLYVSEGALHALTAGRIYHLAECANGLMVLVNDECQLHGFSPEFVAEHFEVNDTE